MEKNNDYQHFEEFEYIMYIKLEWNWFLQHSTKTMLTLAFYHSTNGQKSVRAHVTLCHHLQAKHQALRGKIVQICLQA